MRIHPCILIFATAAALATTACDTGTSPIFGSTGGNAGSSTGLSVTPNTAHLTVGGTVQLSTNATAAQGSIEWASLSSTIAAVSPTGLVTAIAAGSATITAKLASDTTQSGSATITVTP